MVLKPETNKELSLIENIKGGDRASFDALVQLHQQRGLNIAYSMVGNLEDAKDILQEAFVKVYLNIRGFQEKSKFSTWFYRIIVNCSLDFLRKKKSSSRTFVELTPDDEGQQRQLEIADISKEPARLAVVSELGRNIQEHISRLPQNQRLCFVLKHQDGLNTQEISRILRCSPSTVKVHLFRAVNALRVSLAKYLV